MKDTVRDTYDVRTESEKVSWKNTKDRDTTYPGAHNMSYNVKCILNQFLIDEYNLDFSKEGYMAKLIHI
jgi:hypothetical protein